MIEEVADAPLVLDDGRFARFQQIQWWDQARLAAAHVLVIGAGALGNEIIKNLALLGVGRLTIVDMDAIETSNLTRSSLFRDDDTGKYKAIRAADAARDLYRRLEVEAIVGNVLADVGLGVFLSADIVVGAVDNREARVFINSACARVGRAWIDGGIEVLQGIARGFAPPATACYECTMSEVDWQLINRRRSCTMLARRAMEQGGTPTTPTTASIIGAIQAQEVVKRLHGLPAMHGEGFVFDGSSYTSYTVAYQIDPGCPWHEPVSAIEAPAPGSWEAPLHDLWTLAASHLGKADALELAREIVEHLTCVNCGTIRRLLRPIDAVTESEARCEGCGGDAVPQFLHSIEVGSPYLAMSPKEIGLPPRDIIWARSGEEFHGFELDGGSR